jgi:predicted esterase
MRTMKRFFAFLPALCFATAVFAAPWLKPGGLSEFNVELPTDLRKVAGRGQLSPVKHALIAVAVPANFDPAFNWPILVVSATSDPNFHSSRQLLSAYADTAVAAGWIVIAVDPGEKVTVEQDDVPLRYALNTAALAALDLQWSGAHKAPLAFGGFSGGAKYSGWLAAGFASQGRAIVGIYLAGINQDTIYDAATQFKVLNDTFKRIPIFLQSGEKDAIATPADHRAVQETLRRAGFKNVLIGSFPGGHEVEPAPLATALDWFHELAVPPASAK